eukprot:PLAT4466.1.p2 GENE.PLAT4466.1~~PLAT4466.1.p2  ORF type:complete len:134 (-),score=54.44 PLAT4466.1:108-488(-)
MTDGDIYLSKEDYDVLSALHGLIPVPALRCGAVKPVCVEGLEVDAEDGLVEAADLPSPTRTAGKDDELPDDVEVEFEAGVAGEEEEEEDVEVELATDTATSPRYGARASHAASRSMAEERRRRRLK